MASLANLKHLSLSGNVITDTLTSSFLRQLSKLTKLNVSRNDISAVKSDALQGCRQLTVVDLSKNGLVRIQRETFRALASLKVLYLCSNLIESIPDDLFDVNSSLVELDLSNNVLSDIGRFLLNVSQLQRLDLSKNLLSEIRLSAFTNLANLVYLDVSERQPTGRSAGWTFTRAVRRGRS